MSYEIVYNRVAIKVGEDQYILLLQSGSNNCFEINLRGREVAEKNWFPYPIDGKDEERFPVVSAADIEKQLASDCKKYSDESGYICLWKSRNRMWKTDSFCIWIRNAIKRPMTVEKLVAINGAQRLYIRRKGIHGDGFPCEICTDLTDIESTEDLVKFVEKMQADDDTLGIVWKLNRDLRTTTRRRK